MNMSVVSIRGSESYRTIIIGAMIIVRYDSDPRIKTTLIDYDQWRYEDHK